MLQLIKTSDKIRKTFDLNKVIKGNITVFLRFKQNIKPCTLIKRNYNKFNYYGNNYISLEKLLFTSNNEFICYLNSRLM